MKKKLSLILAAMLVSQILFSCAAEPTENPADATTPSEIADTTASAESENEAPSLSDDIPEIDFGGEEFVFLTTDIPTLQPVIEKALADVRGE